MRFVNMILCAALLAAVGCSSTKPPEGPTVVRPGKLRTLLRDDRERLAGIDSARHRRNTYFGVDVTGENFLTATGHIIWSAPARLFRFASGETPLKSAAAMEDDKSADRRREGILALVQNRFARRPPYTKRYEQIGARDSEYTVRAAAIRALNYSRNTDAVDLYVNGLDDEEAAVRIESAKALSNIPTTKGMAKLIAHLQKDDSKDMRIACADALRNYKQLDVARALTAVMNERDFSVAWQARQSLVLMTGRDFRYDEAAWLGYLSSEQKPFI
jgi:HEAT repeat protein